MNTITIYKVTCTKAYSAWEQGASYRLAPWGDNTAYYEGYDDGGEEYELPDRFHTDECVAGSTEIYDQFDQHCPLTELHGRPAILTRQGYMTLKRA